MKDVARDRNMKMMKAAYGGGAAQEEEGEEQQPAPKRPKQK